MTLDHYSLCPCGSGKKIKFCCSNDILPELDKIYRAIEGEQRNAALDQVNHLMEFKGKRMSLLALRAELLLALRDADGATQAAQDFIQRDSTNPIALSYAALASVQRDDIATALQRLHRAIEVSLERRVLNEVTMEAVHGVALLLLAHNDVLGARAYLSLERAFQEGPGAADAERMIDAIDRNPDLIVLLKQDFVPRDCPTGVVWRDEFAQALETMSRGRWWKACESFEELSTRYPGQPSILFNLAILRSRLGNVQLTASAWRAYSQLPTVPLEEAVEACALSRTVDSRLDDTCDVVRVTYTLSETERLVERLLSNRRFISVPRVTENWDAEDGPPPKAAFLFLDRAPAAAGEELTLATLPRSLGTLFVFGRQTDRAPRLEFSSVQQAEFPAAVATVREACGDSLADTGTPTTEGQVSALGELLQPSQVFPPGTPPEQQRKLVDEALRRAVLETWAKRSWKSLDGKRPVDVAADPAYRVRLLAEILLLEHRLAKQPLTFEFNELRTSLGLPVLGPLAGSDVQVAQLPLVRLHRLQWETLADDELATALLIGQHLDMRRVKAAAGRELLRRDSLRTHPARLAACMAVAQTADELPEAVRWLQEGATLAETLQHSAASFLMAELPLQIYSGSPERVMEIVQRLQSRYGNEPGVGEGLARILQPFLQFTPDGRTMLRLPRAAPAGGPAAAKPASSGLWTPDQGAPAVAPPTAPAAAPAPAASPSKLWIPGMD
ncbi:MAG: hypothetical protein U0935_11470 [Pirellulales bacterium]